jgi:di/tricarboxylate transporter
VLRCLQDGKEVVVESWASRHKQALLVCFALTVFGFLLVYPIFKEPEKQNCLALLVFASLLWCTEAIPLFVTSMLVPFLIVVLRVLDDVEQEPPARLTPKQAAPAVFHTMFSQVRWALLFAALAVALTAGVCCRLPNCSDSKLQQLKSRCQPEFGPHNIR